jgi:DNA-binding HxlR family transcriptional regulator
MGMRRLDLRYLRDMRFAVAVLFQGKWRVEILCALRYGPVRLGELARALPGASKKMLTRNLRELEAARIVVRRDMSDLVLHVEYELEDTVREGVCDVLDHLAKWGGLHLDAP